MSNDVSDAPILKKNLFRLFLLTFSGSIIYGLPYFRLYYYDTYQATYNLTNLQMGALGSAYGICGLFSYLLGGVLADKFKAKNLIVFSLITTGLGGFLHLIYPTYTSILAVYAVWGVTSLLTFWPALIKEIRLQGSPKEQGRVYGLFEGGRGVVNAIHLALATAAFGVLLHKANGAMGIRGVIILYSVLTFAAGVLVFFFITETATAAAVKESKKFQWSELVQVVKMPAVWLVTFLLCASYTFNMSFYYFTPYSTKVFGATAVLGAVLTVLAQYCRPVAATTAGFLGDRFGKSRLLIGGFSCMALATFAVLLIPGSASMVPVLIAACIVIYLAMYSNYGLFYALLEEGHVPIKVSGLAIGLISTIGYIPEVLCPAIAGKLFDKYPGATGFKIYFTGMVCVALIGAVLAFVWLRTYGTQREASRKLASSLDPSES
ncbi:MAG TPA: MFS transporter [Holophaga sp.]|nr:MFS transporter [Holophaga sp.]